MVALIVKIFKQNGRRNSDRPIIVFGDFVIWNTTRITTRWANLPIACLWAKSVIALSKV